MDKDLELFHRWQKSGSKADLKALINNLSPIIYSETRKLSGSLPESAIKGELVGWTMRAIKSFDPSKGVKLSTHVMNWTRKTRRLNYTYQNQAALGEDKQLQFRHYAHAKSVLEDELGRDPTHAELGKQLGWKPKEVEKYQSLLFADQAESGNLYDPKHSSFQTDSMKLNYIKDSLTPDERKLFDLRVKGLPSDEAARQLGMNINQYNYSVSKLRARVAQLQGNFSVWEN